MFDQHESRRQFIVSIGKATAATAIASTIINSCLREKSVGSGPVSGTVITIDLAAAENAPLTAIGEAISP